MSAEQQVPIFRDLSGDDPDPEITEIESLCMNCHKNGMTRLLLTRIPHYKNVIIMSFSCEECGYQNNEIQPGGAFAEMGVRWQLSVETPADLNRQVVKSDYTGAVIPELELEVPAQSQKGEVTTVEGIVARAVAGLTQSLESTGAESSPLAAVLRRLDDLRTLRTTWHLTLEDVSGNCFIENPYAPNSDPRCKQTHFTRSEQQDRVLGIYTDRETSEGSSLLTPADPTSMGYDKMIGEEVMQFRTNCPECNAPADTNMKVTEIPHFKQVVIMATVCDACGHRTNEVKSGGGVEDRGVRFEVKVRGKEDFSRDILKSETCSLNIPEVELEVGGRALGGRFTTIEGLLQGTVDQLRNAPGVIGDAPVENKGSLESVILRLEEVLSGGGKAVTVVLDDPAGNSYVQSLADDDTQPDDGLKISRYERSFDQNEELGLNDMKTEDYEDS